jgi:hypothetical protein
VLPRDVMFTGALYRLGNLTIDGGKSVTLQIFHAYQVQTKINKLINCIKIYYTQNI